MLPVVQVKVGGSPQSAFTVPTTFPASGTSVRAEVNGEDVAFSRTSPTTITLRNPARAGSIVNFYQVNTPSTTGLVYVGSIDFPSIAALGTNDQAVSVQGAEVGDVVSFGLPPSPQVGLVFAGFVSAANTVVLRATNVTAGALDAPVGTYRISVSKA